MRVHQEPIQAGDRFHHPNPVTHQEECIKGTALVFKEIGANDVLHAPMCHDLYSL